MSQGPSIKGTIGADVSPLKRSLNEAQTVIKNFTKNAEGQFRKAADSTGPLGSAFSAIGGKATLIIAGVAAVAAGFRNLVAYGGEVKDMAQRFDSNAESIQRLEYAAKITGTSLEKLGAVTNKVTLSAQEAIGGSDDLAASFTSLGINAEQFLNSDLEGKTLMLADAYDKASGNAERQAELLKLIGARGSEIFPMLTGGAAALRDTMGQINPIAEETIGILDDIGDSWDWIATGARNATGAVVGFIHATGKHLGDGLAEIFSDANIDPTVSEEYNNGQKRADEEKRRRDERAAENQKRIAEAQQALADEYNEKEEDALERRIKLQEDIAKLQRNAYIESLSDAEKVVAIEEEIARLKELESQSSFDEQRLGYSKDILEKEKELASVKKQISQDTEQEQDKANQKQERAARQAKSAAATLADQARATAEQHERGAEALKEQKKNAIAIADAQSQGVAGNSSMSSESRGDANRQARKEKRAFEKDRRQGGRDVKTGEITDHNKAQSKLDKQIRNGTISADDADVVQKEIDRVAHPERFKKAPGAGRSKGASSLGQDKKSAEDQTPTVKWEQDPEQKQKQAAKEKTQEADSRSISDMALSLKNIEKNMAALEKRIQVMRG
jgi:microcompartment protein CcmK/EutM